MSYLTVDNKQRPGLIERAKPARGPSQPHRLDRVEERFVQIKSGVASSNPARVGYIYIFIYVYQNKLFQIVAIHYLYTTCNSRK